MRPDDPTDLDRQDEGGLASRCGYVTLLGAPNAGKSTLMNALVGEDLSIVTPKAQTTWQRVTGIRTSEAHQLIFLDTPGIRSAQSLLHRSLLLSAEEAAREADIVVIIADPLNPLSNAERDALQGIVAQGSAVCIGAVNKVDAAGPEAVEREREWLEELSGRPAHLVSARQGTGLEELVRDLEEHLPAGPFLYPEDEIASAPVRFFVAEMVRQTIFERFHQEIPYSCMCRVEEFREGGDRTYIQVTICVERASQKGMLIGEKGSAIRALGTTARRRIEHFLERPVYLDLWVKVLPGWSRKPEVLRSLGLPVPRQDRAP